MNNVTLSGFQIIFMAIAIKISALRAYFVTAEWMGLR